MSNQSALLLREYDALSSLYSAMPKTIGSSVFSHRQEFTWTCIDVSEEYIAVGTNLGQLFLYDRSKGVIRHQLSSRTNADPVSCVRMISSVDYVVAVGHASGLVSVFQLLSLRTKTNSTMRMFLVEDVHKAGVSCLHWSRNAMKLFSGDGEGRVVCTEIDYTKNCSSSYTLCEEVHPIVQLDYMPRVLLISTLARSLLCFLEDTTRFVQVGQAERKSLGAFGATFIPGSLQVSDAKLFASRPGLRLWKADVSGTVEATLLFRDQLTHFCDNAALLRDLILEGSESTRNEDRQFGRLLLYTTSCLLTYQGTCLYLLDYTQNAVRCYSSNVGQIMDVAICKDEVYILRKFTHRPLIRLSQQPVFDISTVKAEVPRVSNIHTSTQHLIGQRAGSWLNALKDVKDKVQSVTPALPKLLPNVMMELTVPNRASKQDAVDNLSTNLCENISSKDTERELQKDSNSCEYIRRMDVSAQTPASESTRDCCLCSEETISESTQLTSELLSRLHVGASSVSNNICDQNGELDPSQSNVSGEHSSQSAAENNIDCSHTLSLAETSSCDIRQSLSSTDHETLQYNDLMSQPVVMLPPTVLRTFSADVSDSTEIIFSSSRKKIKPAKQVKSADAVSLTSCDSTDSVQSSTLPVSAPVPPSSLSPSAVSEDRSSESGQCKSPPLLLVSMDLELLRNEDRILELVSPPIQHSPVKSLLGSDAICAADDVNDHIYNTTDCTKDHTSAINGDEMPEVGDQTSAVSENDFESIYSRNLLIPADEASLEMSLDDAIMNSLMTSHPNDFKDVVRPVSFCEYPESESSSENGVHVKSDVAQHSIPRQITIPRSSQNSNNYVSRSLSVAGTRQSMVVNNWLQLPAPANVLSLSVSSRHVWCIDASHKMLYSQLRGPGLRWFIVTTAPAQQVSVSPSGSLVWRLDSGSAYAACNVSARQPWGNKWIEVARDVSWISVDNHAAWYVRAGGEVSMQKNLWRDRPGFRASRVDTVAEMIQIVCRNGVVWGLTADHNIVIRVGITDTVEQGTEWTFLQGCGPTLAVASFDLASDGTAWVMDVVGRLWFTMDVSAAQPEGSGLWWQVPLSRSLMGDAAAVKAIQSNPLQALASADRGGLVCAACNGTWICPRYKDMLYVCLGSVVGYRWDVVSYSQASSVDCLECISATTSCVWLSQSNASMLCIVRPAHGVSQLIEVSPPDAVVPCLCLSASSEAVWCVLDDGSVYVRAQIRPDTCPQGRYWQHVNLEQLDQSKEKLVHVSVGSQSVWAVTDAGNIYFRTVVTQPLSSPLHPAWLPVTDGQKSAVQFCQVVTSENDLVIWALDVRRCVYVRDGVSQEFPYGTRWKFIPGCKADRLTCSNTYVYVLDTAGELLVRLAVASSNKQWHKVPGALRTIAVTGDDDLWGVDFNAQLVQRHVYFLERSPVLESLVGEKSMKMTDDGWVMV